MTAPQTSPELSAVRVKAAIAMIQTVVAEHPDATVQELIETLTSIAAEMEVLYPGQ